MGPPEHSDDESAGSPRVLSLEDSGEWPIPETGQRPPEAEPLQRLGESISFEQPSESAPPTASPTDSIPRIMAAISQLEGMVEQRLSALQSFIDRELRPKAMREKIIDRPNAELQENKQDFLLKFQQPIFIDLIQLHDDISKTIESQPAEDADRAAPVQAALEPIRTAILDILNRQGVEPFQIEGDVFDPRRQRAVATVPADEPGQNRTIAGRLRPGFRVGEMIIRAELVSVYTLRACKRLP